MLNSAISPDAACFVGKVCSQLWSTWGASLGEGKSGVIVGKVDTKVAHRARAGQRLPFSSGFFSDLQLTVTDVMVDLMAGAGIAFSSGITLLLGAHLTTG